MSFQIGAFVLPMVAGFDLDQQYSPQGGESLLRTVSGRGIKQTTYNKLRITTSGTGWIPSGLETIDYKEQHLVRCVVPRAVPAVMATRQATLPAARRSDSGFTPFGFALKADGSVVNTPATLAGHVATLAAVAGAIAYQAAYYPEFTAWINRPTSSGNLSDATYRWELIAEEV